MKCPNNEQLAQYDAGHLPTERQAAITEHVAACAECRTVLAGLAGTDRLLAALPAPVMPADLWPGVAQRLHARRTWWQVWGKATTAAGLAASLLLGYLAYHGATATLPTASGMANGYVADHQLLSAQDPLADRASLGVALTSYTREAP